MSKIGGSAGERGGERAAADIVLLPPEDEATEMDVSELSEALRDQGFDAVAEGERVRSFTLRELFETPVAVDGSDVTLHRRLQATVPLADAMVLPLTEVAWFLPAGSDADEGEESVRRVTLAEVLDTELRLPTEETTTLRELYETTLSGDATTAMADVEELLTTRSVVVEDELWGSTLTVGDEEFRFEEFAWGEFPAFGDEQPYALFEMVPLALRIGEDGGNRVYEVLDDPETAYAEGVLFRELLEESVDLDVEPAIGSAGAIPGLEVFAGPVILLGAKFVRDHWKDLLELVKTVDKFQRDRVPEAAIIKTTFVIERADGTRTEVAYEGPVDEFDEVVASLQTVTT